MFYETVECHWRLLIAGSLIDRNTSALIWFGAGLTITYVSWYVWTFKLALLWRPSEPKPLPYLVPCKTNGPHIIITLTSGYSHW